ncbi:hypothetical protein ACLOJK_030035 [Asimina triloba]
MLSLQYRAVSASCRGNEIIDNGGMEKDLCIKPKPPWRFGWDLGAVAWMIEWFEPCKVENIDAPPKVIRV